MSDLLAVGPMTDGGAPIARRFHLIWADKIVFWLALAWVAMIFVAWALALIACGVAGAQLLLQDTILQAIEVGLILIVPFWLFLRGLDALFGGRARRVRPRG